MKNSEFLGRKLLSELVFVVVSIIDRGLSPAVGSADGGYLRLLLGCDGLLTVAPLKVEGLVESGDEVGADELKDRGLSCGEGDAISGKLFVCRQFQISSSPVFHAGKGGVW